MTYHPEMNDDYFTIVDGKILCFEFSYAVFDTDNIESGNCYETREEAEKKLRDDIALAIALEQARDPRRKGKAK